MKYSGHRKLLCDLSKLPKFNAFNLLGYQLNSDASILVYKFRPERTGFNMCGRVYATEINFPCITFLYQHTFKIENLFLIRTPDMVKCYGEEQKSFEL